MVRIEVGVKFLHVGIEFLRKTGEEVVRADRTGHPIHESEAEHQGIHVANNVEPRDRTREPLLKGGEAGCRDMESLALAEAGTFLDASANEGGGLEAAESRINGARAVAERSHRSGRKGAAEIVAGSGLLVDETEKRVAEK